MNWVITALLLIVGLINFVPLLGLLSVDKLNTLYAISIDDPNLEILMRHRAVLFGIVGAFIMAAAFIPSWQWLAVAVGLISMVAFIAIGYQVGDYNADIAKVIKIDWVAIALALLAGVFKVIHE